jgi:hypothetical protein
MRAIAVSARLSAGILSTLLLCAPIAMAAGPTQGDTSGPAAGTNVAPSAATQKQVSTPERSTAAGAPGAAGKQGAESGEQTNKHSLSKKQQ